MTLCVILPSEKTGVPLPEVGHTYTITILEKGVVHIFHLGVADECRGTTVHLAEGGLPVIIECFLDVLPL